jgi:hypothetical protein
MITNLNRLIAGESTHCPGCLAPRCRLILSSGGKILEGFGCSPIKRVHELGLIRRKSVWSLSSEETNSKKGETF